MLNSVILYEGPSALPNQHSTNITVVMTGIDRPSANIKTGPTAQVWILVTDHSPIDAERSGHSAAICGDCPLQGNGCYVRHVRGTNPVWKNLPKTRHINSLTPKEMTWLTRRMGSLHIRLGAYGDPVAAPLEIYGLCLRNNSGITGYTHQWRIAHHDWKSICMASVETVDDAQQAQRLGWRTYRIRPTAEAPVLSNESVCPYETISLRCIDCKACNGHQGRRQTTGIVTTAHGSQRKKFLIHCEPKSNVQPDA